VPVLRMLNTPLAELRQRGEALARRLRSIEGIASVVVAEDVAYAGGGSLPDQAMRTIVLEVVACGVSEEVLALRLRTGDPAVLGRLRDSKVVLDLRTIFEHQEDALLQAMHLATG